MCTAATYQTKDFYFGRTLHYEFSYGENITITSRNYSIPFHAMGRMERHYAMIGMAHIMKGYPLYYDAVNEKGLCMAGLNFTGNAVYKKDDSKKNNIAAYELIPWILSQCATVSEAECLLKKINLTGAPFCSSLPAAKLHWMIADCKKAVTVEPVKEGLRIDNNPAGVLANKPPFDTQMFLLNNFANLPPKSGSSEPEAESVGQFFHILDSADRKRGCCTVGDGKCEITIYTSCCNASQGIYYYTSYDNHQISAVHMHKENLDSTGLACYPLLNKEQIYMQN